MPWKPLGLQGLGFSRHQALRVRSAAVRSAAVTALRHTTRTGSVLQPPPKSRNEPRSIPTLHTNQEASQALEPQQASRLPSAQHWARARAPLPAPCAHTASALIRRIHIGSEDRSHAITHGIQTQGIARLARKRCGGADAPGKSGRYARRAQTQLHPGAV